MLKSLKYVMLLVMLLFTLPVNAQKCAKSMLSQVSDINSSWHPIVGNSTYTIRKQKATIIVLRLYDDNKTYADPETDDIQAIFVKSNGECKLVAIVFSSIDRVLSNIDLLVK
jgi:hypothetical protein